MASLRKRYMETIDYMVANPDATAKLREAIDDELIKRRCTYDGKPMPISLMPVLIEPHELKLLRRASERLASVIGKTIVASMHDKRISDYFTYDEVPKDWSLANPGYTQQIPLARLDCLFDGKVLKFIEFNTDNPGGKGWTDAYEDVISAMPIFRHILPPAEKKIAHRVTRAVYDTVMECWSDYSSGEAKPYVAFIDFRESDSREDSLLTAEYFRSQGVDADLYDPRDFRFRKGEGLYFHEKKIDVIVRCMKGIEFVWARDELGELISAIKSEAVCFVNSFRSLLGSEKSILSAITNPEFYHYFSRDEIKVIIDHVPWTRCTSEVRTRTIEGTEVDLGEYLLANQKSMVLKPNRGFGGKDVLLGPHASEEEWRALVGKAIGTKDWVAQEYIEVPTLRTPVMAQKDGKNAFTLARKFFNLSPFVFGGKYVGCLGRISDHAVVNVSKGGAVVAVYNAEEPAD
ncbi:MAG: hypothetical protein NUW37_18090 [Planctomycetes bacterium]|nr:hypothetical protein [Planctomycetota bacterium]